MQAEPIAWHPAACSLNLQPAYCVLSPPFESMVKTQALHYADVPSLLMLTWQCMWSHPYAQVQFTLEAGPAKNLGAFLDGLQQLERSNTYLQDHGSLAAVRNASQHSQHVFDRALQQCEADFITTLNDGYKTCKPSLEWLNEHAADTITGEHGKV